MSKLQEIYIQYYYINFILRKNNEQNLNISIIYWFLAHTLRTSITYETIMLKGCVLKGGDNENH